MKGIIDGKLTFYVTCVRVDRVRWWMGDQCGCVWVSMVMGVGASVGVSVRALKRVSNCTRGYATTVAFMAETDSSSIVIRKYKNNR